MANEMIQPYTGPETIDVAAIASRLVDLAPGAMRGLRREQPGLDAVVAELQAGIPVLGAKAAISSDAYAVFLDTHALIGKIREARLFVGKLSEVLEESEAYYEDQRESDITLMATAVRMSVRHKDPSLGAAFEKMLTYNSQIALKAVKTRRKNAEAEAGSSSGKPAGGQTPSTEIPAGGAPEGAP